MDHIQNAPAPPLGRMMAFIDGENLLFRYQEMLKKGMIPRDDIVHKKEAIVWSKNTIRPFWNVIKRATYYTYIIGDDEKISEINKLIKTLVFNQYHVYNMRQPIKIPEHLTPCIFKKHRNKKAKGVDIQMTVDILTNIYQDNLDTIFLVSGDGDYLPVIQEALRKGKQVYLSAFSSGLNEQMVHIVDEFIKLDYIYFKSDDLLRTEKQKGNINREVIK